jgi:hypothetical protein
MSKIHYPNIEKAFKFKVTKNGKEYRVDTCLPGTPIVGRGKTEVEAKYHLCVNWLYLIANYKGNHGGDSGYVPIILEILKEDMQKLGEKIQ